MTALTIYCPACAEYAAVEPAKIGTVSPGEVEWRCPHCGTGWVIDMQFREETDVRAPSSREEA